MRIIDPTTARRRVDPIIDPISDEFNIERLTRKANTLDDIVRYLWPELQTTVPLDHPDWEPGDDVFEWSGGDALEFIGGTISDRGLTDAG